MTSTFRVRDTAVLIRNVPGAGPCSGDMGAIVHVSSPDSCEVEFVTASGRTESVQTLSTSDLRPLQDDNLLAVRPIGSRKGVA